MQTWFCHHLDRPRFIALVILTILSVIAAPRSIAHAASIIRVSPTGTTTWPCGGTWGTACTLQTALTNAVSGDEIWVMAGMHKPTTGSDRAATLQLKNGVAVYGGFGGWETGRVQRDPATNVVTLSGDIGTAGNNGDNSYHVVTGATGATLDGVTISDGNANGGSSNNYGGGMYNSTGNPTLNNVTFSGNSAGERGGGMYNSSSSPTLTNITFSSNSASYGGGMYNASSSNALLTNVTFSGNSVTVYGGGIYNYFSSPTLTNVTFSDNSASGGGGGIYNWLSSNPQVENSILWGNTSPGGQQIFNNGGTFAIVTNSVVQNGYAGGTNIITADPLLGTLGNYGGSTQTRPLLPGSSAINATSTNCSDSDQRGVTRSSPACDIGAFESRGFTLTKNGGDNQSTFVYTTFATTLGATITANNASEPVNGGKVTFTAPGSGASTNPMTNIATIGTGGTVSQSVTANNTAGSYNVAASASGATSINFSLTNTLPPILYAIPGGLTSGACQSWANACELRYALTSSSAGSGQEIWVKSGAYTPTNGTDRNATFQLKNGVAIYGGFAMTETLRSQRNWATNVVTLSGDIGTLGNNGDNSYHVVTGATGATLDGVTISDGNANGSYADPCGTECGGGMFNVSSSPTLTNVIFSGNSADSSGGGMYNRDNSSPTLTNVTFNGNYAYSSGGGMYNRDNSSPTMTNVTFNSNSTTNYGGGMTNSSSSNPILTNVTFSGNSSYAAGGMYNYSNSSPMLTNVTFSGNSASGGMFSYGGGIYNNQSSNPQVRNSILWGNTAPAGAQVYNDSSTPTVTYSDVQSGYSGTGNINIDPLLVALANNGGSTQTRALAYNSPAIDAGDPSNCPATDQRGKPRDDLRCDMGAYERTYEDGNQVQKSNLTQGTAYTFGPAQGKVTRNTTDDPGTLTLIKIPAWASQPSNAITRLWDISTTGSTYTLTLSLCFTASELNGLTPSNLRLWRYNGSSWENKDGTLDTTNPNISCVWSSGITALSRWTLATANPGSTPTGVNVIRWAAIPEPNAVRLEWQTLLDLGVVGYQVERSLDGKTFTSIGNLVPAIGGGTYSMKDTTLPRGKTATYRLIAVVTDGTRQVIGTVTGSIGSQYFLPLVTR